ncbi:MAG TPA: M67 family metallopeptidase [Phycisphaerae bacterium]|jgi:proteasome lid subunit RPN8/RPN11
MNLLTLNPMALSDMLVHAAESYPNECCGIVLGSSSAISQTVRARNLATEPRRNYVVDPLAILKAESGDRSISVDIAGFYHSHPDHPGVPSGLDMEQSWDTYLYIIIPVFGGKAGVPRAWRFVDRIPVEIALVSEAS